MFHSILAEAFLLWLFPGWSCFRRIRRDFDLAFGLGKVQDVPDDSWGGDISLAGCGAIALRCATFDHFGVEFLTTLQIVVR